MNEFLTQIKVPALGSPTFATDLQEVFRTIDENFKKIVSAPYLEGQEGKSVTATDVDIITYDTSTNGYELTDFGRGLAQCVFGPTVTDFASIDTIAQPVSPNILVSDYLIEHPQMKVLATYSPDTGEIDGYLCGAESYMFQDLRVEDLNNVSDHSRVASFVDYTCLVFAQYTDGDWIFSKGTFLPTLYYNDDLGYFCWKINDSETAIRAQGIKGDTGIAPTAAIVRGTGREVESSTGEKIIRIYLTDYSDWTSYTDEETGELVTNTDWVSINTSNIQDGDMVTCLFTITDQEYNTTYPDMLIGNVRITGPEDSRIYTITLPSSTRFSNLWKSYLLFYAFQQIDYKSTDTSKTKAIFIPAATDGITHAVFQDDSTVRYAEVDGEWTSEDTDPHDTLVVKKVHEDRLLGEYSIGDANRMTAPDSRTDFQSELDVIGYDVHVDGKAHATVDSIPDVVLGTPVGCIMNWIDMTAIPDGWVQTGEVTEIVPPVFALKETNSEDYDVILKTAGTILKKFTFTTPDFVKRDKRYAKIFCAVTGLQYGLPIEIQTSQTRYDDYLRVEHFDWTMFDWTEVAETGVVFYLTKYIGEI